MSSYNKETAADTLCGKLHIVATPLGNADDLTPRAKSILERVPLVLAEDTKRASLNFSRWGIKAKRLISFNDHSEEKKLEHALSFLQQGEDIALVSDAGMPVISDPGYLIVKACREKNIDVTVIPGACAPVTALAGSGIAPNPFTFFGFLPRKTGDMEKNLAPFAGIGTTLVFFERKDRIADTLKYLHTLLGPREVCLARELTKDHEEYILFNLENIPDLDRLLGELTVIIGPPLCSRKTAETEVTALIAKEKLLGGTPKQIAKRVQARCTGWTTSEIYALATRN